MASIDQRVQFCTNYLVNKNGQPFDLTGRDWVLDEFWRPADGFKWWAADEETPLCTECKALAGAISEWTWDNPTQTPDHHASGCKGLALRPIIVTILNLPRREGKTFNTAAYNLSSIFQGKNKSILYVAAAEAQTDKLFRDNYVSPVHSNKALTKASKITGGLLQVPANKSMLECVATSHSSITGTGRTHVVIDEARDVPGRTMLAAIMSAIDENGLECPFGHMHSRASPNEPSHCTVCRERLIPWYGRVIIMSSSGLIDGSDSAWFHELIEHLEQNPDPNYHLFRMTESRNPNVSMEMKGAYERVFSKVDGLKELVEVEVHNRPTRKGDSFLTKSQVEACVDKKLGNREGSAGKCVAFLDTSTTVELTSLVICEEVEQPEDRRYVPFERMKVIRIDVWDPKLQAGGVIDPEIVQAHLDLYMPFFPGIVELAVDARLQPWAERLVMFCNRNRPWGKKVHAFRGQAAERIAAWDSFEQRVLGRTLTFPAHGILLKELQGVRKVRRPDGRVEVRDASRKTRHADIADGLANCCYLAHLQAMITRGSLTEANANTPTQSLLNRIYRPQVRGLTENGF